MTKGRPIRLTTPPENTPEECDSALGLYLRAWEQINMTVLALFSKLLDTHQSASLILLRAGIDQPTQRAILEAASKLRLQKKDQEELGRLLRRWRTATTKRNRIVHGHWLLVVAMVPGPSGKRDHTKSHWVRIYPPADPILVDAVLRNRDQKSRTNYMFTLKQIHQGAEDVKKLAQEIGGFTDQLQPKPFETPRPIEPP